MTPTKRPLTSSDVRKLLTACRTGFERETILLMATLGLPVSVLGKLGPRNLIQRDGHLILKWQLPYSDRIIESPVPDEMAPWVRAWLALPIMAKYEGRRDGQPHRWASNDFYQKLVKAVAARAGLPGVNPSALRNSAAYAFAQSLGLRAACELTGVTPSVIASFEPGNVEGGRGEAVAAALRALTEPPEATPL